MLRKLIYLAVVAILIQSCVGYYETVIRSNDADLKYEAAFHYYNKGKFRKSAELFESLILLMQGLPQEDTVQFYNALSNYKFGDFVIAGNNFEKFINVFPRSPFAEEAKYLRIKCLYEGTYRYELDQTPTRKAMTVISEFMYENPNSQYYEECDAMMKEFMERLDRKSYESAKLYYTVEDYQAAHYALKNVLKDNADNIYREDVLYYTALASYKYALNSIQEKQKERYLTFIDDYYNFIGEFADSPRRKELDDYYSKAITFTKKSDLNEEIEQALTKEEKREAQKRGKIALKEVKKAEKLKKKSNKEARKEGGKENKEEKEK